MKIFITIQTFSTVVFTVWLLYVWIEDSNFGSQPGCNHLVKYVLLFATVKVTMTWLRVLFIIYLVINACTLLFRFGVILSVYMENLRKDIHDKVRNVVTRPGAERVEQPEQENVRQEANPERRVRAYVNFSVVYVPRPKSPASFSNVFAYQIGGVWCRDARVDCAYHSRCQRMHADGELQVNRNRPNIQPGENTWGFGQIIAIVLIFGSVIDIVVTIRERLARQAEGPSSEEGTKLSPGV